MLTLALLTSHGCGTLLSSDFYKEQLRDAEVYDFLYDELLLAAVEDAIESDEGLPPGVDVGADEVVASLRDALPPDWLQEQVEAAIDSAGPYFLNDADAFSLSVDLNERADAAEAAAFSLMERVDLHESFFAEEVPEVVAKRLREDGELPLGIQITQEEAVAAIERVVTPRHVGAQQTEAAEALAEYLVGRRDSYAFTFTFTERTPELEHELTEIFEQADLEGYVRREVLAPALDENVTADVVMPLGVVVSREEIRAAIEAAATSEWLQVETMRLVDEIVPYLSARKDGFSLIVPLVERTDAAIRELTVTVKEKYAQLLTSVPMCTSAQLRALARDGAVDLCLPEGFTTDDFLWAVGIDVEASLGEAVHDMTPDEVTFTEQDLLAETLGTDAGELILDLRETMSEGLTIDEEDLREALAEQDEGLPSVMDTLREGFSEGWTWTEQDLREVIADPDSPDAEEALATFDRARGAVGGLRLLLALPLVFALGLVAGAGFLGGRTWPARLGWAGGALASAALFAFILTGPLYGSFAGNVLETARAEATIGEDETSRILTDKLWDTVTDASDDIIGVVRIRALLLLALGIAGVAGGMALARRKPRPATPPSAPPQPTPPDSAAAAETPTAEAEAGGQAGESVKEEGQPAEAEAATPAEGEPAEASEAESVEAPSPDAGDDATADDAPSDTSEEAPESESPQEEAEKPQTP